MSKSAKITGVINEARAHNETKRGKVSVMVVDQDLEVTCALESDERVDQIKHDPRFQKSSSTRHSIAPGTVGDCTEKVVHQSRGAVKGSLQEKVEFADERLGFHEAVDKKKVVALKKKQELKARFAQEHKAVEALRETTEDGKSGASGNHAERQRTLWNRPTEFYKCFTADSTAHETVRPLAPRKTDLEPGDRMRSTRSKISTSARANLDREQRQQTKQRQEAELRDLAPPPLPGRVPTHHSKHTRDRVHSGPPRRGRQADDLLVREF
jgi:hypothetical protein